MPSTFKQFITAAKNGDLASLNTLLLEGGFDPVVADNQALRSAAAHGHLDVVNRLLEIDVVQKNASAWNNEALRLTVANGHLDIVNRLLQIPAVEVNAATLDNSALRLAVRNGHLDIVNRLLQIPAVEENAATDYNAALCWAARNGHLDIVNRLLQIPAVEANAAAKNNKALRKAATRGHLAVVNRLLQIPAVEANATTGNNYLLREANRRGHQAIVNRLLEIPAVRAAVLAADNASADLRELAQNRENSMRALNLHEQGIINTLKTRYPAMSDVAQRHATLQQLRAFLATACEKDGTPAAVHFTPAQLQELSAYCRARFENRSEPVLSDDAALLLKQLDSTPHRALRYLSEAPNPFMAPDANHVESLSNGRRANIAQNDWELIALLWKLLNDETAERYGDASLHDCQETFIHTLSLLARAHNYDHDEKTDDNLLDKPSCWMGVTRRLIESIPYFAISDNPDTRPLDATYLERRFKDQCITNDETGLKPLIKALPLSTLRDIQQAIQVLIDAENLTEEQAALLDGLKLPEEIIASFIAECKPYYGELRFAALRDFRYLNQSYPTTEHFIRALANNLREFYLMEIHQFVTQEIEANSKEEDNTEPMIEEPSSTYTPSHKRKRDDEEEAIPTQPPRQRQRMTEEAETMKTSNDDEEITTQSCCRIA